MKTLLVKWKIMVVCGVALGAMYVLRPKGYLREDQSKFISNTLKYRDGLWVSENLNYLTILKQSTPFEQYQIASNFCTSVSGINPGIAQTHKYLYAIESLNGLECNIVFLEIFQTSDFPFSINNYFYRHWYLKKIIPIKLSYIKKMLVALSVLIDQVDQPQKTVLIDRISELQSRFAKVESSYLHEKRHGSQQ